MWPEAPGKRALERAWLAYTPVWGALTGVVMLGGFAERWGDAALLAFGVALALGALVAALLGAPPEERARPWHERTGIKAYAGVVVLAFGLNALQTPFFFDVLHMRYGVAATLTIDRNPVFLYLVTIAYFATYSVLACLAVRAVRRATASAPRALAWCAVALVPFALAFLETVLNANPFMTRLFCYDDPPLMLGFGTAIYGVSFVLATPVWMSLDEREGARRSLAWVVLAMTAVVLVDAAVLAVVRATIAPLVTTVVDGSPAYGGCLER